MSQNMDSLNDLHECLEGLQRDLANIDLHNRSSSRSAIGFLILRLDKIAIRMDRNENHQRPHFHIDYGEHYHTATYAVDTGERLAGKLPNNYDRTITAWTNRNRALLLDLWKKIRADEEYENILVALKANS